jgi:hypothetical protein
LNSPHPNIFKFVDHLKTLDADMVLKCIEFKRNPLDYSKYTKATKHFTLKNIDKRVSTQKSLPIKKTQGTIKNKQPIPVKITKDSESK